MKYLLSITFFIILIPSLKAEEPQNKDWRESWENIGLLYKDENNPLIQKIHLHGRNHINLVMSMVLLMEMTLIMILMNLEECTVEQH